MNNVFTIFGARVTVTHNWQVTIKQDKWNGIKVDLKMWYFTNNNKQYPFLYNYKSNNSFFYLKYILWWYSHNSNQKLLTYRYLKMRFQLYSYTYLKPKANIGNIFEITPSLTFDESETACIHKEENNVNKWGNFLDTVILSNN